MDKLSRKTLLLAVPVLLSLSAGAVFTGGSLQALADENQEQIKAQQKAAAEKRAAEKQEAIDRVKKAREALAERKTKLDSAKLRICEVREKKISTLRTAMSNGRNTNLRVLNNLSQRIQNFYQTEELSVSNYEELVAAVNDKKAAAEAAVAALQTAAPSFSCDGEDPKGDGNIFKTEHQKAITALKEYKTAIKNLFTAVKEAAKTAEGSN